MRLIPTLSAPMLALLLIASLSACSGVKKTDTARTLENYSVIPTVGPMGYTDNDQYYMAPIGARYASGKSSDLDLDP